ncbi:DUF3048 domain-containing protein [Niallia alba]|uniref:DUF3048 domain-containing protein n=1 Tax=Niallia alba TaxID=2729105 RepID=UPI002E23C569|nr:DUF3048 domain-containing protein [Niallia alba]
MKKSLFVFLFLLLTLTACNDEPKDVSNHNGNQTGNGVKDDQGLEDLATLYPLTGLPSNTESTDRAVTVMINNHPDARPQTGLTDADIVYELLAEGEVTRFLAVYQSYKPKVVGPVRSSRDYYIELAKGYNSLYIAHGYSPEAKKLLTNGYIDNLNGMEYDGTLFKRSSARVAPHNSYISFANIEKGAKANNYSLTGAPEPLLFLKATELEAMEGEEANSVSINYGKNPSFNSQFIYDEDAQKYIRFSNGEQTVDNETNASVAVDNVFIVETSHKVVDNKGRKEIDLTSGGQAYLLQHGKWQDVNWKNIDGRILPFKGDKQVGFVPGKTWINIIPSTPGLKDAVILKE